MADPERFRFMHPILQGLGLRKDPKVAHLEAYLNEVQALPTPIGLSSLDIEHSAIPVLSAGQLAKIMIAGHELMDSWSPDMRRYTAVLAQQLKGVSNQPSSEEMADILAAARTEAFKDQELPASTRTLLYETGLRLNDPMEISYAFSYIRTVGFIKRAQSNQDLSDSQRDKEISVQREILAQEESGLMTLRRVGITGERIGEIRVLVEEVFQKGPVITPFEEIPEAKTSKEEFDKHKVEIENAVRRMWKDTPESLGLLGQGRNRFSQAVEAAVTSQWIDLSVLEPFRYAGVVLGRYKVPQILEVYGNLRKNKPLPNNAEEFIKEISETNAPGFILWTMGVSRENVENFLNIFFKQAPKDVSHSFYILVKVLYAMRQGGFNLASHKLLSQAHRQLLAVLPKEYNIAELGLEEMIGVMLYFAMKAYLNPHALKAYSQSPFLLGCATRVKQHIDGKTLG